jgi:TonB-linked SusC/RagA family outer membrane protein
MYQRGYQSYVLQQRDTTGDYLPFTFGPDVPGVTDQYAKTITPTVYSTLNYETTIASDHHLRGLAGYEQLHFSNQSLRGRRITTVAPVLTELSGYSAAGEQLYFTHPRLPGVPGPSEWAMQSLFGRVNYSYKGKYLLEGNIRYDGTSKVSPDYRWGLFPSVSAGWVVSEEPFFRNEFDWVSQFKLRASYGTLGNQDVGTYLYQDNLAINVNYPFGNTALSQGAVITTFRDQSLRWESTRVTDLGFDLNIRRGLLGVTFDWFRKLTYDILATQPIPASLGLGGPTTNDGKLENRGFELELTHQHHIGQVNYGANFQISTAKNKLLHIRTPNKGSMIREVGLPYDEHFLYEWDGIFQVEDINNPRVPRHVGNPTPREGDIKMKDQDKDGDVDTDDRIVVKGAYPDYLYSFGFNVDYKGVSLSTFFQGVKGLKNRVTGWGVEPFHQHAAPSTKWRNAWTPQNRSNTMPALYIQNYPGIQNYTASTYFLQDASYFRLKNIMLSYNFPRSLVSKVKLKDLSIYLSADNVFTITDYEGNDPERASTTGNFAAYPQARILNLGFNVKL